MEILRVLVSVHLKLASKFSCQLFVVPFLNMKVSLALFLFGGSRLFSLIELVIISTYCTCLQWSVNLTFAGLQKSNTSHKLSTCCQAQLSSFTINLLVVYRESVNLIGYVTRRLSADSLQL